MRHKLILALAALIGYFSLAGLFWIFGMGGDSSLLLALVLSVTCYVFWAASPWSAREKLKKPENREKFIRTRVAELDEEIEPHQKERGRLQAELETLEQKKGYRGSR